MGDFTFRFAKYFTNQDPIHVVISWIDGKLFTYTRAESLNIVECLRETGGLSHCSVILISQNQFKLMLKPFSCKI